MIKKPIQRFTVSIPVKPYIRRFLEINYGLPVDFSNHAFQNKHFRDLLAHRICHNDRKIPDQFSTYTENIEILICEKDFYKHGWELTKTNIVAFGSFYEDRAKFLMRQNIGISIALGIPLNKSINKFQQRFGFYEDVWHYESIKKDFYRNSTNTVLDYEDEIFSKMQNILLRNLYDLGTISQQTKNNYEYIW